MEATTTWMFVVQAIGTFGIIATLWVYCRLLIVTQRQEKSRTLLRLMESLQAGDLPTERAALRKLGQQRRPYHKWSDGDRELARRVCRSYDFAGILIRNGLVLPDPILENWGESICKCYRAAEPLIEEARRERGADFWDDFEWLAELCSARDRSSTDDHTAALTG